jgi:hypothetical protein
MRFFVLVAALASFQLASPPASLADDLFAEATFPNQGRSVAAEFAELNGDGRVDLFVVALVGLPPKERRTIRVYLQRPDASFPAYPDHLVAVPGWSAVYDLADLREDSPGEELVLLRPDGVTLLSLADASGRQWELRVPGPTTVGLADDERGFEPFRIVYRDFGPEPWLLVPQIGQLTALSPSGEAKARIALPRRANYLIFPDSGLLSLESDFQIFLDVPKLMLGDVDGDGRVDIVSSTRHEIRVFLRREDGSFAFEPDRRLALGLVTPRDHIRGSGGVSSVAKDIDGDGRLDLLVSHVQGSVTDATTTTYTYINDDGGWKLGEPNQTLTQKGSLSSNALFDVDGDGRMELLRLAFRFSVVEVIKLLVSREINIKLSVHRYQEGLGFVDKAWTKRKLELPFSFQTFRLKGFIPAANADLNSDGLLDLVTSGGGKFVQVDPGGPKGPFSARGGRQSVPTAGVVHFEDYDLDGLPDFLIFDPHNCDVPVRIGRNLGQLPGSPATIRAR